MSGAEGPVLVTVPVSPLRLGMATVGQAAFGALLIAVGLTLPSGSLGWGVVFAGLGVLSFWSAWGLWRTGRRRLVLTREALSDDTGVQLCRIDEIAAVGRSVFALKPARGFALTLKAPRPRAWVPGLWWRVGRRMGVGGITSAGETRLMAEMIEALVAERDARP